MYRMIIVEDDDNEREGLRDVVDWKSMGIEVVGAFEGSRDALRFVQDNSIDILFTDIKLFGMDGLELARKIKEYIPNIKVVISSAYQEFEYARTAIELNAFGYISKPVNMNELRGIIEKVLGICRTEEEGIKESQRLKQIVSRSLPLLKDRFLHNLVTGNVDPSEIMENFEYFNIKMKNSSLLTIISDIDNFEEVKSGKSKEEIHVLSFKILEILDGLKESCPETNSITFQLDPGRYCTILNHEFKDLMDYHETTITYAMDMQNAVNTICDINITIAIGKSVIKPENLQISYKTACDTLKHRFSMGSNQIMNYADVCDVSDNETIPDIETNLIKIISCVEICDINGLEESIESLFMQFEKCKNDSNFIRNNCLNLVARVSVMLASKNESFEKVFGKEQLIWEKLLKFDTIYDVRIWLRNILCAILDYLNKKKEGNNKKIIAEILKIVEQKYNKNLTIMDISKEVYLSPNYICIIFREELGVNFTDYLIRYRLKKAEQFLHDQQLKIYQVGSMVGYSSISHFCSIFKEFYGVSPSEYREKI